MKAFLGFSKPFFPCFQIFKDSLLLASVKCRSCHTFHLSQIYTKVFFGGLSKEQWLVVKLIRHFINNFGVSPSSDYWCIRATFDANFSGAEQKLGGEQKRQIKGIGSAEQ